VSFWSKQAFQEGVLEIPPARTSGLGLTKVGGDWSVGDIVPGSPVERTEIRIGDIIVSINDVPARSLLRDDLARLTDQNDMLRFVEAVS
jgi:S1-C subfamily serine protease